MFLLIPQLTLRQAAAEHLLLHAPAERRLLASDMLCLSCVMTKLTRIFDSANNALCCASQIVCVCVCGWKDGQLIANTALEMVDPVDVVGAATCLTLLADACAGSDVRLLECVVRVPVHVRVMLCRRC